MKRTILSLSVILFCSWSLHGQSAWIQKANFPGTARDYDAGFSIGHYGFIGCGHDASNTTYNDFYKWDQTTNTWTKISNYPGLGYGYSPIGFTIEGKGYVGMGWGGVGENDFWRFDTITNSWAKMASFPGSGRYDASWFVIGHKAYILTGSTGGPPYIGDAWVYDAHQNTWKQLKTPPYGNVDGGASFAIGKHGYFVGGWDGSNMYAAGYEYDTASDSWTSIPNIPNYDPGVSGDSRTWVKGSKAYVFNGDNSVTHTLTQGWVYDTVTKNWCEFTDMGKMQRIYTAAFVVNNRFYMGTGMDSIGVYHNDYWEYASGTKFTVSDTVSCTSDTARFSATTNYTNISSWSWSFPGGNPATSNLQNPNIIYANPGTYSVTLIVNACGGIDTVTRTITIKSAGLKGITIKGNPTICSGTPDTLTASGGGTYLWSTGATTSSIIISPNASATYTVKVTKGCSQDTSISVKVNPAPIVSLSGKDTICAGNSTVLNATGGGTYKWSNGSTSASTVVSPNVTSIYSVVVTSNNGCPKDTTVKVIVNPLPAISIAGKDSICLGGSTTLYASGGGTYKWNTGATTSSIIVAPRNTSVYSLAVTTNGCSKDTSILINVSTIDASISKPVTICQGDSTTLYTSGGGTYKWSTGASTSSISVKPPSTTTYSVIITNGACVKDTSVTVTVKICSTSGIENYHGTSSLVNVYPNPNTGNFTISLPGVNQKCTIHIYNVLSQQVYQSNINSANSEINLSNQAKGIYLYRVLSETGDLIGEGKVVVQ